MAMECGKLCFSFLRPVGDFSRAPRGPYSRSQPEPCPLISALSEDHLPVFHLPDFPLLVPQCLRARLGAFGTAWFSGQHGLNHVGSGDPHGPAPHSASEMGRTGACQRGLGWPKDK